MASPRRRQDYRRSFNWDLPAVPPPEGDGEESRAWQSVAMAPSRRIRGPRLCLQVARPMVQPKATPFAEGAHEGRSHVFWKGCRRVRPPSSRGGWRARRLPCRSAKMQGQEKPSNPDWGLDAGR